MDGEVVCPNHPTEAAGRQGYKTLLYFSSLTNSLTNDRCLFVAKAALYMERHR